MRQRNAAPHSLGRVVRVVCADGDGVSMTVIFLLVWLHFLADFVLQSDKMSKEKSSDAAVLALHVGIYTLIFAPFALFSLSSWASFHFIAITYATHFATDFLTSRATKNLWMRGEIHWFFVVVGLDQAIHMTTLFTTYQWLKP